MNITTSLTFADTSGNVQVLNASNSDNSAPIYYELETQQLDFDNLAYLKKISGKIGTLNEYDVASSLDVKADDDDYKSAKISSNNRVNIGEMANVEGNFFTFKWYGETSSSSPVFDGLYIEKITNLGIVSK